MVNLIAYPFRLDNKGSVQTTEDGEDYYAQELACLVQTRPGERPLVPLYGITDPTFDSLKKVELIERVAMFGPPVTIQTIDADRLDEANIKININYVPTDPDNIADPVGINDSGFGDSENQYDYNGNNAVYLDATEGG